MQGQRKASNTTTSEIVLESLREQIIKELDEDTVINIEF